MERREKQGNNHINPAKHPSNSNPRKNQNEKAPNTATTTTRPIIIITNPPLPNIPNSTSPHLVHLLAFFPPPTTAL
jgi:hypothetical protein